MKQLLHSVLIASIITVICNGNLHAQIPGTLDSAFGASGVYIIPPDSGLERANDMLVLSNDKILVVGTTDGPGSVGAIFRLTGEGTLDSTFGDHGRTLLDVDTDHLDYAEGLALQPDGKIIVVGTVITGVPAYYYAARLTQEGTLDSAFGVNGVSIIQAGSNNACAYAAVVQQDGKIVLAGRSNGLVTHNASLLRLLPDGSLDTGYGVAGFANTNFITQYASYNDVTLMDDGSVIAAGFTGTAPYDIFVTRYDSNGLPVPGFGVSGFATFDLSYGYDDNAYAIIRHPADGRILVAGKVGYGYTGSNFVIMAITLAGTPDSSFGVNGITSFDATTYDLISDLAVQSDGKIVASGSSGYDSQTEDWTVMRFNEDGSLDTTFGLSSGYTLSPLGTYYSNANAIGVQSDGSIVTAGVLGNYNTDMAVARYHGNNLPNAINEQQDATGSGIFIQPNPARNNVFISMKTAARPSSVAEIQLLNVFGKVVYSQTTNVDHGAINRTLNLPDNLPSGNYLLMIRVNGTISHTQVVLQR